MILMAMASGHVQMEGDGRLQSSFGTLRNHFALMFGNRPLICAVSAHRQ